MVERAASDTADNLCFVGSTVIRHTAPDLASGNHSLGGCQNTLGKIQRLFQAYGRKTHGIFSSRCWPLICAFTHNVSCAGNLCTRQNLSRFTRMKTDPAPGVFPLFS